MPFVLRPFRRFPVQCVVTYNVASCIEATHTPRTS
jgi:hypothetical protein